jgi:hypothetical protein
VVLDDKDTMRDHKGIEDEHVDEDEDCEDQDEWKDEATKMMTITKCGNLVPESLVEDSLDMGKLVGKDGLDLGANNSLHDLDDGIAAMGTGTRADGQDVPEDSHDLALVERHAGPHQVCKGSVRPQGHVGVVGRLESLAQFRTNCLFTVANHELLEATLIAAVLGSETLPKRRAQLALLRHSIGLLLEDALSQRHATDL